jgi:hypothetical protein
MNKIAITAAVMSLAATFSTSAFAAKPPRDGGPKGAGIEKLDTNGDGAVSREEFEAGAMEKAARFFDRLDTNGDGVLTEADRNRAKERRGDGPGNAEERRGGGKHHDHKHGEGEHRPD